jgi:Zn-dependent protease
MIGVTTGVPLGVAFGLSAGILWIVGAFVSIMIHELGHVMAGQALGSKGEIILTPLGGLAGGCADLYSRRDRIIVYLAGPLAQLLFAAILWLVTWQIIIPRLVDKLVDESIANHGVLDSNSFLLHLSSFCFFLIAFNVGIAVFNLLPIPPLDGGKIMQELTGRSGHGNRAPWEQDPDAWKRR